MTGILVRPNGVYKSIVVSANDECIKKGEMCHSPLQCRKQKDGSHACDCAPGYKKIRSGKGTKCEGNMQYWINRLI